MKAAVTLIAKTLFQSAVASSVAGAVGPEMPPLLTSRSTALTCSISETISASLPRSQEMKVRPASAASRSPPGRYFFEEAGQLLQRLEEIHAMTRKLGKKQHARIGIDSHSP